jgi:hypothetical protein
LCVAIYKYMHMCVSQVCAHLHVRVSIRKCVLVWKLLSKYEAVRLSIENDQLLAGVRCLTPSGALFSPFVGCSRKHLKSLSTRVSAVQLSKADVCLDLDTLDEIMSQMGDDDDEDEEDSAAGSR